MDNFSEENKEQNQEELINELIQAHSENIENQAQENDPPESTEGSENSTDNKTNVNSEEGKQSEENKPEIASFEQQGEIENIQDLVKQADEEANLPIKTSKKFVISVQEEYISYFEKLSVEKRSLLINEFLKSEIANKSKRERKKLIKKILRHILIIVLTIVIGFPIIFYIVNSSIQSTLKSYKYMQVNFEKLYQQKNLNKLN